MYTNPHEADNNVRTASILRVWKEQKKKKVNRMPAETENARYNISLSLNAMTWKLDTFKKEEKKKEEINKMKKKAKAQKKNKRKITRLQL